MNFILFLLYYLIFISLIFCILTLIGNPEAVQDDDDPIDDNEVKKDEADDNNANECPNDQFPDVNNNPEVSTIDDARARVISDDEDKNELCKAQNGPVSALNDNRKVLPIGEVQSPAVPVVKDENEVTEKLLTFVLGNDSEAPVINDGNERSNATEIQPPENEPSQSAANEPPAVGNVEFDFSVLDGDLRERPPQFIEFLINNHRPQSRWPSSLRSTTQDPVIDVANFFAGYLKITAGTTGNRYMSIKIEKESQAKMSLCVKKYEPRLKVWFMNREGYSRPREDFENSYGKKFTSTCLNIDFNHEDADSTTLAYYKEENNEFGWMMLELRVDQKVKIGYIRFDWDSTREIIDPSFYNYHLQMGNLKIMRNKENRLEYCRNKKCSNEACEKPICSRLIKEAYFNQTTLLTLIYLPKSKRPRYDVTVEKSFQDAGLRFLFRGWLTLTTMLHEHAFTLSQTEKNPFGINFGNPRTRNNLEDWLRKGNVLKVNINLKKRKDGYIKHTIRFELRHDDDRLVPTIRDVDPSQRHFPSYSSSRNQSRNHSFSTFSTFSSTSNLSFC